MLKLRKSGDRGHANHGWLDSHHSFSFADYHDPQHMGVGNLRVINEDRIAPGTGFGTHGHRDMEIVSVVLDGALAHQDSLGHGGEAGVIRAGDVQRMSAGTGVRHSEFNHAADQTTHFLQIWILPRSGGIDPSYEQRRFDETDKRGKLRLIVSPDGRDGSVSLNADASIQAGLFDGPEEAADLTLDPRRPAYVFLARGALQVNGIALAAGDAMTVRDESLLRLRQGQQADVLVFELSD